MGQERDDSGAFTPETTNHDIVEAIKAVHGPAITTSEVQDHCDCSKTTAKNRLRELEDAGRVDSRNAPAAMLWWLR